MVDPTTRPFADKGSGEPENAHVSVAPPDSLATDRTAGRLGLDPLTSDPLTIAGRVLRSRLLLGTGGFPSLTLLARRSARAARNW